MNGSRRRVLMLVAALLGLVAVQVLLLSFWNRAWYAADDAFISFRYADNWASGHGLVFNPGERVEGYSNFLFVAVIAAAIRLGVTPLLAAHLLNIASSAVVLGLLLGALPAPFRTSRARFFAAVIFVSSYHTTANILCALEAPFFAMWLLVSTLAVEHRRRSIAFVACLGMALTRPEGVIFAMILAAYDLGRELLSGGGRGWRVALTWGAFAIPFGGYQAWRIWYFGHLLPNSVVAKMGHDPAVSLRQALKYLEKGLSLYWPLLIIAGIGWLFFSWRFSRDGSERPKVPWAVLAMLLSVVGLVLKTGSGDPYRDFLRYLFPALPILLVVAIGSVAHLERTMPRRLFKLVGVPVLLVLAGLQVSLAWNPLELPNRLAKAPVKIPEGAELLFRQDPGPAARESSKVPLGLYALADWLTKNAEPGQLLGTAEIGILSYYSGIRILDTYGLVTRHIAALPGLPSQKSDPDYVFGLEPDYFAFKKARGCLCKGIGADMAIFQNPRFQRRYEFVDSFPGFTGVILLFAKRSEPVQPRVTKDLCPDFGATSLVLKDPGGKIVEKRPEWLQGTAVKKTVERFGKDHRDQLLNRLRPILLKREQDSAVSELVKEWVSRWGCFIRQLPTDRTKHDLALVYPVSLAEANALRFQYGLHKDLRTQAQGGEMTFEVHVVTGQARHPVFEEKVEMAEAPSWRSAEIDLTPFAGSDVELELRVHREISAGRFNIHSGWLDLELIEKAAFSDGFETGDTAAWSEE